MLSTTSAKLAAALAVAQLSVGFPSTHVSEWQELSRSLEGRLHHNSPFAFPCFPIVNGQNTSVNTEECSTIQAGYTTPDFRSPRHPAYMLPQWETCQKTEEKCLLDSADPSNPAALEVPCRQGSVSEYYIDVSGPEDVKKAFKFAEKTKISLSIKSSGHDYKGRSSLKGSLSLWTRNLNKMSYNANFVPEAGREHSERAITVGAGVPFEKLYAFVDEHNVTIVGGYHQTISPSGGWVMGGGHSILSPVYGMGVDRVLQFKIVTPDGKYRVANAYKNKDLFWALRGGGGSTFGVVMESTMLVEPQMKLQVASVSFNKTSTNYHPFLKILVNHSYRWGTEGWGGHMGPTNLINVNPLLTLDQAKASLQPVSDYVRAQNGTVVIEELPSWLAFFNKYVISAQASVGVPITLGTRLISTDLFTEEDGKEALTSTMIAMVEKYNVNPYIIVGTPFLYNETKGATSITPAWRNSLWHMSGRGAWNFNSTVAEIREQYGIAGTVAQMMRNITPGSGAYFNEGDVYEPNHEESFWGSNYPRLLAIKKKYDPKSLLDCWQCVGWKGAQDARYSCYL